MRQMEAESRKRFSLEILRKKKSGQSNYVQILGRLTNVVD